MEIRIPLGSRRSSRPEEAKTKKGTAVPKKKQLISTSITVSKPKCESSTVSEKQKPWKTSSSSTESSSKMISEQNDENINNRNQQQKNAASQKYLAPKPKTSNVSLSVQVTSISNTMYDDNWANKQIAGFTEWMNFIFSSSFSDPIRDEESTSLVDSTSEGGDSECMRNLLDKRTEARLRQKVFQIYKSAELTEPLLAVEEEISEKRFVVRNDRNLLVDLGLQEELFGLLFSYEMPWLRLGLEVVFGEIISVHSPGNKTSSTSIPCVRGCPKWKAAIKMFIHQRMLNNEDVVAAFSKQKLLGVAQQKKLNELLRQHLLKKFMHLVLLLDVSRTNALIPLPTLFVKTASVKSSKEMILAFCRNFMRGEGDIMRHLTLLGYAVSFNQTYIHEYDYPVTNLAVDLRDGVRLARLLELLTGCKDISNSLRVPAVSRLQKLHNVGLVFRTLFSPPLISASLIAGYGAPATLDASQEARHVVDGNRDRTLLLLWKLLYSFELRMLVDYQKINEEVETIRGSECWRKSIYGVDDVTGFSVNVPVRDADGNVHYPATHSGMAAAAATTNAGADGSDMISYALTQWCDAIAGQYGVPVYNLTSCLSDGRALCLLVHYYHPTILTTKMIRNTTVTILNRQYFDGTGEPSALSEFMESSQATSRADMKKGVEGERRNYALLRYACSSIGGIPLMLPDYDTTNPPEEKTMIIFLGYLFARLIESAKEVQAAIRIQRFIRGSLCKAGYIVRKTVSVPETGAATSSSSSSSAAASKNSTKQRPSIRTSIFKSRSLAKTIIKSTMDVPVSIAISPSHAAVVLQRNIRCMLARVRCAGIMEERATELLRITEEANRLRQAEEEAVMQAVAEEEARMRVIAEALEAERAAREAEALRIQEEERARQEAVDSMRRKLEEEEESFRKLEEEGQHIRELEEQAEFARRLQEEEKQLRQQQEEEEEERVQKLREEEEDRLRRIEEKEERVRRLREEEEEKLRRIEEEEERVRRLREEEEENLRRIKAEEARVAAVAEAARLAAEETERERLRLVAEAAETEQRRRVEAEAAIAAALEIQRKAAEEETKRLQEEERRRQEEERRQLDDERRRLEEDRKQLEEERRRVEELEAARLAAIAAQEEIKRLEEEAAKREAELAAAAEGKRVADEEAERRRREEEAIKLEELRRAIEAETRARCEAELRCEMEAKLCMGEAARAKAVEEARETLAMKMELERRMQEEDITRRLATEQLTMDFEDRVNSERNVRSELELKLAEEAHARLAAEARLKAIEEAAIESATAKAREEQAARDTATARFAASIRMQTIWRCHAAVTLKRRLMSAIVSLQANHRGYVVRQDLRKSSLAATRIEATWRGVTPRRWYITAKTSTVRIQSIWRRAIIRNRINCQRTAATKITQWWRLTVGGMRQRVLYEATRCNIIALQALWRSVRARTAYQTTRRSVVRLQSIARSSNARKLYTRKLSSVRVLQTACRSAVLRWSASTARVAAQFERRVESVRRAAAYRIVQRFLRCVAMGMGLRKSAYKILQWWQACLPYLRVKKLCKGFKRLQAFFRSKKIRAALRNSKIEAAFARIQAAEKRARADPSLKLGKQTSTALHTLQTGKMMSQLLKACQTLLMSTQLSSRCCEAFARAGASKILIALIRSCNRSTPHQELLRNALMVLLNVARHDNYASCVAESADAADTLVDLMQMFRDKASIFCSSTELLVRLVAASDSVKTLCNGVDYRKRIDGINHIIERKHRLEARVRKVQLNCSVANPNSSFSINVHTAFASNSAGERISILNWGRSKRVGKFLAEEEPIVCIQHLLGLLK